MICYIVFQFLPSNHRDIGHYPGGNFMYKSSYCLVIFSFLIGCTHIQTKNSSFAGVAQPINSIKIVTITKVTPVIKTYKYTEEVELIEKPRGCNFYGGASGGIIGILACMGYDTLELLPEKEVEKTATEKIYEIVLSNGEVIYSLNRFYLGDNIEYEKIKQVQIEE